MGFEEPGSSSKTTVFFTGPTFFEVLEALGSRGFSVFLEKEGIGVALLLKGVTKTPSCMRNVLGNLMTPAVLFVALEIKKIRL